MQNSAKASPVTYTFHPFDWQGQKQDIEDLNHYNYYIWEISNFSLASNLKIVGASLTFNNIYDWTNESNDQLYIHLFDANPAMSTSPTLIRLNTGVDAGSFASYDTKLYQGTDNQGGGDNFAGKGYQITPTWSDPVGDIPANTIVFDFAHLGGSIATAADVNAHLAAQIGDIIPGNVNILTTLEAYLRNGNNFSFGFDPDCHYYNDSVSFTITVDSAPVPEPATMLLFGTGIAGLAAVGRRKRN